MYDPRFNENAGQFNERIFDEDYGFLNDIVEKERKVGLVYIFVDYMSQYAGSYIPGLSNSSPNRKLFIDDLCQKFPIFSKF